MICVAIVVIRLGAIRAHAVIEDPWPRGNIPRARMLASLENTPGQHLIIVRYEPSHQPDPEWVYNAADIDASKVVWARDMSEHDNQELLQYFGNRRIWLLEADQSPPKLTPYPLLETSQQSLDQGTVSRPASK